MTITIGHTPDSDDAFMFSALARGKIDTGGLDVRLVLEDIETLNNWAMEGRLDVTAISFHAYTQIHKKYALLPCGASIGMGYGPILVGRKKMTLQALRKQTIAVPGEKTTAFLLLRIFLGEFPYTVLPFDRIPGAVLSGEFPAGLLIHEGQLTYAQMGLTKLLDLGSRWNRVTHLPLPLGGNAVKKDLGPALIGKIASLLHESIKWGLSNRTEAMISAMEHARGADTSLIDNFVGMYVNMFTLSYGKRGKKAVKTLLRMGWKKGVIPAHIVPEYLPENV